MSERKTADTTLRSIYEEDGSMPDMSKLDQKHDGRWGKTFAYFVGVIILGTLVAWLGFRLFIPSNPGDVVAVTIDAPEHVTAGGKMTVILQYENNDRNPLALAVLKVRYPKEFVAESSTLRSDDDTLTNWTLGTVDRGGKGMIEIQGRAMGNIGSSAQIQSTLTYKPSSFNAEFTSVANRTFGIDVAPIELTFDGPNEVSAGQTIAVTVRYKNTSDAPLTNTQMVFNPGSAFSVTKTSKTPLRNTTWAISALQPNASGELTITGLVTSSAEVDTTLPFTVVTQLKREEIILAQAGYPLVVAQGELGITIERDSDVPVRVSDGVSGRIVVVNNGTVPLGDITVQLATPASIDWSAATSPLAITSAKGSLSWSGASHEKLKTLPASDQLVIPFTLQTPGTGTRLVLSASAKAAKRNGKAEARSTKSADFTIPLGSNIGADAYALYYDDAGVPVGSGSLPPRVGEETKYRIVWKIKNGARDLTDVSLVAELPEHVVFGAKQGVGAGVISFDAETRIVRWFMSRLPSSVPEVIAQFDVVLTPVANDQGTSAELMGSSTLSAVDASIADPIIVPLDHVTTDISHDRKAGGRSVVLP